MKLILACVVLVCAQAKGNILSTCPDIKCRGTCINLDLVQFQMTDSSTINCAGDQTALQVDGFTLFKKKDSCNQIYISKLCYEKKYSSCHVGQNSSTIKDIAIPFMRTISKQRSISEIKSNVEKQLRESDLSSVLERDYSDSELGNEARIGLSYKCQKLKNVDHHDLCSTVNTTRPETIDLDLNNFPGVSDTCQCSLMSTSEIRIVAYDIRLNSRNKLLLTSGGAEKRLDQKLYWRQDGDLIEPSNDIIITLGGLSEESLPESAWMKVTGQGITLICSPVTSQSSGSTSTESGIAYPYIIIGVLLGLVLCVILVGCVVNRKRKRREELNEVMDDSDHAPIELIEEMVPLQSVEIIYSEPHKPLKQSPLRSKSQNDQSNEEYLELDMQAEETVVVNNNGPDNSELATKPYLLAQEVQGDEIKPDDSAHVYSHFRKRPDIVPSGNIYESTDSAYSTFQKERAPRVIDNIYD